MNSTYQIWDLVIKTFMALVLLAIFRTLNWQPITIQTFNESAMYDSVKKIEMELKDLKRKARIE